MPAKPAASNARSNIDRTLCTSCPYSFLRASTPKSENVKLTVYPLALSYGSSYSSVSSVPLQYSAPARYTSSRTAHGFTEYKSTYVLSPGLISFSVAELPCITSSFALFSHSISKGSSYGNDNSPTVEKAVSESSWISTRHTVP